LIHFHLRNINHVKKWHLWQIHIHPFHWVAGQNMVLINHLSQTILGLGQYISGLVKMVNLFMNCEHPQSSNFFGFFFGNWHLSLAHHKKNLVKLWTIPKYVCCEILQLCNLWHLPEQNLVSEDAWWATDLAHTGRMGRTLVSRASGHCT
jgi:hypothetical protein